MEALLLMHDLEIKNHRGMSYVYYYPEDKINEISKNLKTYEIIFIDEIIEKINHKLYKLVCKKSQQIIKLQSGEDTKRIDNVFKILKDIDALNINPIKRALVVGGGTIQDLSATCLGMIKRGVDWDFIPTTILAQCDSCLGSKTSINSFSSKNKYGLFYPPCEIHIQNNIALKQNNLELLSGLGDALHYLYLNPLKEYDFIMVMMNRINKIGISKYFNEKGKVIELAKHCHLIKKYYIENDEFDKGIRKHLNLGHSFAHAIESLFNYSIPHGIAVMHGIYMAFLLDNFNSNRKVENKIVINNLINILIDVLNKNTIYTTYKVQVKIESNIKLFLSILKKDKKNISNSYNLVLLSDIPYLKEFSKDQLETFLPKILTMINDIL